MSDRFFLDTNIIVYSFDPSSARKSETAQLLLRQALLTRKGAISYQVVQEFFSVAHKHSQGAMRLEQAEHFLSSILGPLCVVNSSPALFHKALQILGRFRLQWYDSLIVAGAMEAKCGILYSEDFQNGQKFDDLEVRNPFL
jgi:predicted nucleic acid-binding protein